MRMDNHEDTEALGHMAHLDVPSLKTVALDLYVAVLFKLDDRLGGEVLQKQRAERRSLG